MTVLDELVTRLTIDDTGFATGLSRTLFSAQAWKRQLKPSLQGIDQAFGSILKTLKNVGIGIGVAGVAMGTVLVKKALESGDALAKLSDRTKVSVETLSGLALAADLAGTSIQTVAKSLNYSQKAISEARNGNVELADSFMRVGLSADELAGLSTEEAYYRIVDASNSLTSASDQTTLRMKLLGRGAVEAASFLAIGSEGMKESKKRADELGISLTRFDAAKIEQVNDAFTESGKAISGVGQTLAIALSPFLTQAAKDFTAAATASGGFKTEIQNAVNSAVKGAAWIVDAWRPVEIALRGVVLGSASIATSFYDVVDAGVEAFDYLGKFLSNFFTALVSTGDVAIDGLKMGWKGLRVVIIEFVAFTQRQMADLISVTAKSAGYLSAEVSTAMVEAAHKLYISAHVQSEIARKEFEATSNSAVDSAEKMKAAWSGVFDIPPATGPIAEATGELAAIAKANFLAARASLDEAVNKPLSGEALLNWADNARVVIDEIAAKIAAAAAPPPPPPNADPDGSLKRAEDYKIALEQSLTDTNETRLFFQENLGLEMDAMIAGQYANAERAEAEHQAQMTYLWESGFEGRLTIASGILNDLAVLQTSHSKKAFEVGKAAAIAETVINTYKSATGAYSALSAIPIVGPALGIAAAAAAIAAGFTNVQKISSTKFGDKGGGGGGGGASAGASAGAAAPSSGQGSGAQRSTNINIALNGSSFGSGGVRDLIAQIDDAVGDNVKLRAF